MDAERLLVLYLNERGVGATAYYDVPRTRPESFVVVERTGGGRSDIVVERPTLDVQCWARSRESAASLASDVTAALSAMPRSVPECFHASVASTFRDRDLESGTPRYHIVCQLTLVDN